MCPGFLNSWCLTVLKCPTTLMSSKTWGKFGCKALLGVTKECVYLEHVLKTWFVLFPSSPSGGNSGAAGGFSLSQPGRDPCFTFAALMGGQPCKERCCIAPAPPQHPPSTRLLHIPLPGAPSRPCQGTEVMGSDHVSFGGSPGPHRACSIKGSS